MALRSYITIQGAGKNHTILDADSMSHLFNAWALTKNFAIKDLTLQNGFNATQEGLFDIYESINFFDEKC